jgi:sensor domain CHASE-containing protein
MSAPSFDPDDFPFGSADKLRATIAQLMATVAMRADMVRDYAFMRDDPGMRYSMKCAAAEFRTATNLLAELAEQLDRERQRERRAPASSPQSKQEARP